VVSCRYNVYYAKLYQLDFKLESSILFKMNDNLGLEHVHVCSLHLFMNKTCIMYYLIVLITVFLGWLFMYRQ